jgi:hypothetical protein
MKHSESITKIAPALLAIQKELKNTAQTANNPFYNSSYAPLNEILDELRPVANKHGVTILQDVKEEQGKLYVSTMALHESGEWIQQEGMPLPIEKNTAQSAGSAFTYGRRYTVQAFFGITSEEDNDANEKPEKKVVSKNDMETKYLALSKEVKDGFKLTGWTLQQIKDKCLMYNFDEVKILADIKAVLK